MSENNALVIFGSTGDLTFQKLLPALARLNDLSSHLIQKIFLIGRQGKTLEEYITYGIDHGLDVKLILSLKKKLHYVFMQASEKDSYTILLPLLKPFKGRYVYLATPPSMFHLITSSLHNHALIEKGNPFHRCAYEKPFGENGSTAHVLNDLLHEVIDEKQLYRVDHYLAKPLIQQLIKIRMQWATVGMENLWKSPTIERIHLVAHETVSILSRGKFYDATGALKDMVQSHLLETLALLMMDLPTRIDDIDAIQHHKISFLTSLKPTMNQLILGQYEGYQQELHVNPTSITETFVRLALTSNTTRWKNTSITIETGKKLDEKKTAIEIFFNDGHRIQFLISPVVKVIIDQDWLATLPLNLANHLRKLMLHPFATEDAYVTVFSDLFQGNQTLFPSNKEIEVTWGLIDLIKQKLPLPIRYRALKDLIRK
jgi:glucose-6-phosphate 1-dehydrogenase